MASSADGEGQTVKTFELVLSKERPRGRADRSGRIGYEAKGKTKTALQWGDPSTHTILGKKMGQYRRVFLDGPGPETLVSQRSNRGARGKGGSWKEKRVYQTLCPENRSKGGKTSEGRSRTVFANKAKIKKTVRAY